jgi:hypothetical protein
MKRYLLYGANKEPREETKREGFTPDSNERSVVPASPNNDLKQKMLAEHVVLFLKKDTEAVLEKNHSQFVGKAKTANKSWQKSKIRFVGFLKEKNTQRIIAVFLGLVLSTFLFKKMVDGLIERTFPVEHKSTVISNLSHKERIAGKEYQNALVRVIVPAETKVKKQLPKPAKIQDIKKQVSLKGTQYTVGYFGGISGLKLTISNQSQHFVNRVELEINYLESNGDIIETDTYQIPALKPDSSQTLCVPPSQKGVKVSYRIMNVYAKQYTLLKEI